MKKHRWLFPKYWLALGLSLVAILGLHLFYLDSQIRSRFEAHRWNLPSRVYSEPFYLYPGQVIALNAVEQRLERLAYKRVAADPKSIGEFTRNKSTLVVYLHDFAYPAGPFSGFPVKISFENDQITQINRYEPQEEIKTLKLEPELLASLFDDKMEDRTLVTIAEIPEDLLHGVVAIEDERFYSHHGIDPLAILRAFLTDLLHLRAVQGGSTLTQQLIKNYFLSSEKTLGRKLNELLMAILLEFRYSKEAILEAYLNEIYFGQKGPVSVTGVQEASRFYFSKDVSYLTPAECALLAGMIRSPGEYSPLKNISKAYDRRNFVLKSMREKDFLPEEEYQKARKEKILVSPDHRKSFQAPYFVDFVQSKLHSDYPENVLRSEGLRIFTTLNPDAQEVAEDAMKHRLSELEEGRPKLKKLRADGKFLEGALIAIKPQTGAIVAFVGGRDYGVSQFDRIPDAHRQPGSSFKPFVYLAALSEMGEKKYTLASTLEDVAYTTRAGDKDWKPENYDHMEHGTVTLREALEQSYNIATSRLGLDVGLDKIIRLAQEAGIESPLEPFPALSLGASELTPLELARAYTIFPNQGTMVEPIAITSVVTRDGVVLEKKGFRMKKVVDPAFAYLMNHALQGVLDRGTASISRALGFTGLAAGKTGTTSDYKDSWFVGYTPDLLTLTWVGYDDPISTGLSGAAGALPIWTQFMKQMNPAGASRTDFQKPENIVLVKIDSSGKLYKSSCAGEAFEEAFLKGTEPTEDCEKPQKEKAERKRRR